MPIFYPVRSAFAKYINAQMMAYARVYGCPKLTLLYPHHAGLLLDDAIVSRHRISGSRDILTTATLDVGDSKTVARQLRMIASLETEPS